jgi:hypothetical protein
MEKKILEEFLKMGDIPIQGKAEIAKSVTLHTVLDASTVADGAVVYRVRLRLSPTVDDKGTDCT